MKESAACYQAIITREKLTTVFPSTIICLPCNPYADKFSKVDSYLINTIVTKSLQLKSVFFMTDFSFIYFIIFVVTRNAQTFRD
jgi:hypothetical protein